MPIAQIVVLCPCFNEEEVIVGSLAKLSGFLGQLMVSGKVSADSFIAIVNDGSKDKSWEILSKIAAENSRVKGISLSRNFGHQNALYSGLLHYSDNADAIITIDIDLQDDLKALEEMIDLYLAGKDIVYGVKKERRSDGFFKRSTALVYYKLLNYMKIDVVYNHADFRLTSRRVNQQLHNIKESDLFLRGIFPYMGFNSDCVYYDLKDREHGESKYSLRKMIGLAWAGILSFTSYPLDILFRISLISIFICFLLALQVIIAYTHGKVVPGWASTTLPIFFLGSVQLFSIGILSKYISRIYNQVKNRPAYIIKDEIK